MTVGRSFLLEACYEPQNGDTTDYVQKDDRMDNGPRSSRRSAHEDQLMTPPHLARDMTMSHRTWHAKVWDCLG
jgi:hypothetical protein